MDQKQIGEPVPELARREKQATNVKEAGLGWKVKEKTLREIEEVEDNMKCAEIYGATLLMG